MNKPIHIDHTKLIILFFGTVMLSGCVSFSSTNSWPKELPPKYLFVDSYYQQQATNSNNDKFTTHIRWVKRFYQGSVIYPLGWNKMTEILLDTIIDPRESENIKLRMYNLGIRICIEWAQNNATRKIDSAAVAVWGNALRTASELNQQSSFIKKIEQDVQSLINGSLDRREIVRERYYPAEDYDNF